MKNSLIEKFISEDRFKGYKDLEEYESNLCFSKDAYIPLCMLEVALRNSIDKLLSAKVGENWHEDSDFITSDSQQKIAQAKELLFKSNSLWIPAFAGMTENRGVR